MNEKRCSQLTSVNNKIIENVKDDDKFIVSVYDNDRCKYTFYEHFNLIESDAKYDELIDIENEKMTHQF